MNERACITPEQIQDGSINPDTLTSIERVDFLIDARNRRLEGEKLTSEHLKLAVKCMRSERKVRAINAGGKKKKNEAGVVATPLSEF
jgi:hypothetical protein